MVLIIMGRSYWYECGRCGYRAKVSGREDRGLHLFVQTILCRDCKELYDAVTKLRVNRDATPAGHRNNGKRFKTPGHLRVTAKPPEFKAALNRLAYNGLNGATWLQFPLQCPVSPLHRIQKWSDPDKCPRCGLYLEKNPLPYRIWD